MQVPPLISISVVSCISHQRSQGERPLSSHLTGQDSPPAPTPNHTHTIAGNLFALSKGGMLFPPQHVPSFSEFKLRGCDLKVTARVILSVRALSFQ